MPNNSIAFQMFIIVTMMKNPTQPFIVFLLIILPIFSFRIPSPSHQKTAPNSIKLQTSAVNSEGEYMRGTMGGTMGESLRELITYAYMKHGKDKDANAKYISQKFTETHTYWTWIIIIVDKGTSKTVGPYYDYAFNDFMPWAQWDDANPSENWLYLVSGQNRLGYPLNAKYSQRLERGSGITDLMDKTIRKIIDIANGQKQDRAQFISRKIASLLTYQSGWNTLIYRCSADGIGDFTPLINDLWFAPRSPVIPGTDQCYFIFEDWLRQND